jgi:hypothetical protein
MEFAPQSGMRTLREIGNRMGQVLLVDLRIISGAQQDEVQELEDSLWRESPDGWCDLLRDGYEQVRRYMEGLSFDQFENSSCTAYYGSTKTNARWLIEMLGRLLHERAQLFLYLRMLGGRVDGRLLSD